jgi:hypothetical protein
MAILLTFIRSNEIVHTKSVLRITCSEHVQKTDQGYWPYQANIIYWNVGQRQKKAEKSGVVAFRGGDGGTRE